MGKPRKIKSVAQLEKLWEEYKNYCDNKIVLAHDFSQKNAEFVSAELKKPISYTIEGFCVYVRIARSTFYRTYGEDPSYKDILSRMREECEVDAREKFETGQIPHQLSTLWMGHYGYSREERVASAEIPDDGFLKALEGTAGEDWENDE